MKIIISPAKKMVVDQDSFSPSKEPLFFDQTKKILRKMQQLSYMEAQKLWKTSDKLTQENYQRLQEIDLNRQLTPAILSYSGIQYQYPRHFDSTGFRLFTKNITYFVWLLWDP